MENNLEDLRNELAKKEEEFNLLCGELDELKRAGINPNDKKLLILKEKFLNNQKDIVDINERIKNLQNKN